jgi:hypothetical protein
LVALAHAPPEFCNVFGGRVQPVLISREPNHFNGGKPFWRVRGRSPSGVNLPDDIKI